MPEDWKKEALARRRKNFAVEIRINENEILLVVTHNGRQSQCISLFPHEVDKVIDALMPHSNNATENQEIKFLNYAKEILVAHGEYYAAAAIRDVVDRIKESEKNATENQK